MSLLFFLGDKMPLSNNELSDAEIKCLQWMHESAQQLCNGIVYRLSLSKQDNKDSHINSWTRNYNEEISTAMQDLNRMWNQINKED